jgi:RIO-like serine/threonine protein kinase
LGYDFLAIKAMAMRETLQGVGGKCGVGKESDIYFGIDAKGETVIIKVANYDISVVDQWLT